MRRRSGHARRPPTLLVQGPRRTGRSIKVLSRSRDLFETLYSHTPSSRPTDPIILSKRDDRRSTFQNLHNTRVGNVLERSITLSILECQDEPGEIS
jgi:hypothetical protein